MNYLQTKIIGLIKENTGSHMLDSGGGGNRHWQRNAEKKFSFNEDVKMDDYGISIPIHVYMNTMFELDTNTTKFNRLLSKKYYWTQEALAVLLEKHEDLIDVDGYGCGGDNTYNYDSDLSQGMQYEVFEYDGYAYCIVQIHGGADVRGGYTSSQVFKVKDIDYLLSGQKADFYDDSNHEEFESFWSIDNDERYTLSEEKGCFINNETKEEVYPYSSATGF